MTTTDVRLNENAIQLLKSCIGKNLESMIHEMFHFRNSVSQQITLQVDGDALHILSFDEELPFYGTTEDVSVLYVDTKNPLPDPPSPISIPVKEMIRGISVVQEHQELIVDGTLEYEVWLTRGIIIDLGDREIAFEKDTWLSLEIFIHKGEDTLSKFSSTENFINDNWADNCIAKCEREIISL